MLSVADEFDTCDFNDKRLKKRLITLASTFSENPELSIHAACGSAVESKAAYRFFENKKITPDKILSSHINKTAQRANELSEDVLIIHDTTDLIYTQFPSTKGLGERFKLKGYSQGVQGVFLHNTIAVSRSGVPLGLLKQTYYTHEDFRATRASDDVNKRGANKTLPFEEKESFRWVDHFNKTDAFCKPSNRFIHVADRECDIYEFLQNVDTSKSHFVIRSSLNRRTHEGPKTRDTSTIQGHLDSAKTIGTIGIKKDREEIECNVKITTVLLRPPQRLPSAKSKELHPIEVNIVEVKSKDGSSRELNWKLLTNLNCKNLEEAIEVIEIYKQRWSIECFHRILKSGFGIEKARLNERSKIENLSSILSIVSWHVFWLYHFGRKFPKVAAKEIFEKDAIKVLKISAKKLKVPINGNLNAKKAIFILARLGGFAGRKSDGEPGMIVIWRGWKKLHERIAFMEELTYG